MIMITSIQDEKMYINPDLIETMRVTPDTVLFLNNGKRLIVKDSADEIIRRIIEYRQEIFQSVIQPQKLIDGASEGV